MAFRLDAPPAGPRVCLECGTGMQDAHPSAEFCCGPCRKAWNNRRMTRGAELHDLMMVLRYDRGAANGLKVFTLVCRLVAEFRQDDHKHRAGRRSWQNTKSVLDRHPSLRAERLGQMKRR